MFGILLFKSYFSPTPKVILVLLSVILSASFLTVTVQLAVLPLYVLAVIFDVPTPTAVILPLLSIPATLLLSVVNDTCDSVPFSTVVFNV